MPLISKARRVLRRLWLRFPERVACNLCGWRGRRFVSDGWHPRTVCPRCGSTVRHRLLAAALRQPLNDAWAELARGRDVVHFAPEPVLRDLVSAGAASYRTADIARRDVDLNLDMCDMGVLPDASVDLVVACDVLEHVPDDGVALDELNRVLRPGGWAVLTVPQKDGLASTYEDPSITSESGRLAAFGQEDHLRIYGDDFAEVVAGHRFEVAVVDETAFDPALVARHVLFPPVLSPHPLATNHRKVFFAQKSAR